MAAAQTDTSSQRTVPQAGVGTSSLGVKQLHGSESGWAVIRDSSWGRCGVGQLREGHLGARRRCFPRDILTSSDPPPLTSTCVFSFIQPALHLPLPPSLLSAPLPAPLAPVYYQLAQPGQRPAGPQQLLPWLRGSLSGEAAERRAGGTPPSSRWGARRCSSPAEPHQLQKHLSLSPGPAGSIGVTGGRPESC